MFEMFQLPFMQLALLACLLMAVVLAYFGVQVVRRCIVFIDLALAQISSAGVAFATLTGGNPQLDALLFTLIGAFGFSLLPHEEERVPQEAVIGIIYAVASAAAILMLSKTPHADADVTTILFGNILAVTPEQLWEMLWVFLPIALFHALFHQQFFRLSLTHNEASPKKAKRFDLWNLLFYLSLALVISYAIRAAGVLLVFSYLIVPAVLALYLFQKPKHIFMAALGIGILASFGGLYTSYVFDFPTGASIVACFGIIFIGVSLCKPLVKSCLRRP